VKELAIDLTEILSFWRANAHDDGSIYKLKTYKRMFVINVYELRLAGA
jgi:hypothetical protein